MGMGQELEDDRKKGEGEKYVEKKGDGKREVREERRMGVMSREM